MAEDQDVVRGPWPAVLVDQPGADGKWWHRDETGVLWVRCTDQPGWWDVPVPMVELEEELPDRPPERSRITSALDLRGLDGPEVDAALGVADALDTVVDSWEAGAAVPTVEDVRRLAFLTGMAPGWFYLPPVGPLGLPLGTFICRRGR